MSNKCAIISNVDFMDINGYIPDWCILAYKEHSLERSPAQIIRGFNDVIENK